MDPLEEEIPVQIMKSSIFRFQWSNSRVNQVDSTPSAHLRAEKIIVNALGVHNGVLKGRFCEAKLQLHFASILETTYFYAGALSGRSVYFFKNR